MYTYVGELHKLSINRKFNAKKPIEELLRKLNYVYIANIKWTFQLSSD